MRAHALPLLLLGAGFAIAVGCHSGGGGGGSGGGGGKTGNAAVDATLGVLEASINSGLPTIDPSITNGTITNPHIAPTSSQSTIQFAGLANDGTVGSATIAVTVSYIVATGAESRTVVINEASTGFQFLSESTILSPLGYLVRVPPDGTANLDTATGTGQFFAILTVTQTGTVARLFDNTSTTTNATLVNFGTLPGAPASTIDGTLTSSQDYLLEYQLTGAPPVAKLVRMTPGNNTLLFERSGGPSIAQVQLDFTSVTFAGVGANQGDIVVGVANDIPGGISPTAAFNIQGDAVTASNTALVASLTVAFTGPFPASPATFQTSSTFAVASNFVGLTGLNDGQIETGNSITAIAAQIENATNGVTVAHSLSPALALMAGETMQAALYEPEVTTRTVIFWVFD
ncbi:MAG TPA: hypothetical protein VFF73_29010 [Planctomycetota bacterium]|nr:hypothetical protein [Planctomycetota bacterium]